MKTICNFFFFFGIIIFLEIFAPRNLTAYIVNANTLSVTWDLPLNIINDIDKVFITIIELSQTNRTIQMQIFDNTIKKLDVEINDNNLQSIHRNTTILISAQCTNRYRQNSTMVYYQLYINMLSKFVFSCLSVINIFWKVKD